VSHQTRPLQVENRAFLARVCAPRLGARSAETRRIEQYRAKERQYLCRALFQYRAVPPARFRDCGGGWLAGKRVDQALSMSVGR
jgi:hypothetical protein